MQQDKKYEAVALCRVSTPEQRLSGSLGRQEKSVLAAANYLEVTIPPDGWWSGDVSSKAGTNVTRKDLIEIHDYCKQRKKVKFLIVDEVDRFMRSISEMFYWIEMFKMINVRVYFACNPELNNDNSRAKLLLSLDGFKAEGSNEERQSKSIKGHRNALSEGRYTFHPKPGYQKGSEAGRHIPHDKDFIPLQKSFTDALYGRLTLRDALRQLNDSPFSEGRAKWRMDKFKHFIVDEFYAGKVKIGKQVKTSADGDHVAMLTWEEHVMAVDLICNNTKHITRKTSNPNFPLNNLMMCVDCGERGRFSGWMKSNGKGWIKPKYRCRVCNKEWFRDEVNLALDIYLAGVNITKRSKKDLILALREVFMEDQNDRVVKITNLKSKKNRLQKEKSALLSKAANTKSSLSKDYENEALKITKEINKIVQQIEKANNIQDDFIEFAKFAIEHTMNLKASWWELNDEQRRECQQLLFPDGIYFDHSNKVSTPKISPIIRLASTKKALRNTRNALLVELAGSAPASIRFKKYHLQA